MENPEDISLLSTLHLDARRGCFGTSKTHAHVGLAAPCTYYVSGVICAIWMTMLKKSPNGGCLVHRNGMEPLSLPLEGTLEKSSFSNKILYDNR
jgi:hypothetical protein